MNDTQSRAKPVAPAEWRTTLAEAPSVMALLLSATLIVATIVTVTAVSTARGWLGFTFTGVPRTTDEAAAIFAHNLQALGGVAGLLIVAGLPDPTRRVGIVMTALRFVGEGLIAGLVVTNVFVVGAALGAYGPRMVVALLPHGPVELAAFALSLTLYLHARGGGYPVLHALFVLASCVALLAVAATLEVFAAP